MSIALQEGQYELGGFVFGRGTKVLVQRDTDFAPDVEARTGDAAMPREDGIRFGRDYYDGREITLALMFNTHDGDALDVLAAMAQQWRAAHIRQTNAATTVLRYRKGGRTRRVYGRPRKLAIASTMLTKGWGAATATFQCVDHLYYTDDPQVVSVNIVSPPVGGLFGPLTDPLVGVQIGQVQGRVALEGNHPAWCVTRINGPVLDPEIEVVGAWSAKMRLNLRYDEYLDVDPSPWNRRVLRNGKENAAGVFTAGSQRLCQMTVPIGQQEIVLRGTDPSGSASATFSMYPAWSSL